MRKSIKAAFAACLLAGSLLSTSAFGSFVVNYDNVTTNNSSSNIATVEGQLSTVVDLSGGYFSFTFYNNVGLTSSITEVYFGGAGFANFVLVPQTFTTSGNLINSTSGVTDPSFSVGSNPANLPNGFSTYCSLGVCFSADGGGGPTTGINEAADYLTIRLLAKDNSVTLDALKGAFSTGNFLTGLHVINIAGVTSDSFQSCTSTSCVPPCDPAKETCGGTVTGDPLPEPTMPLLIGLALFAMVGVRKMSNASLRK